MLVNDDSRTYTKTYYTPSYDLVHVPTALRCHAEQLRHLQAAATEEKAAATADLVAQLAVVRAWACADGTFAGRWSRPKAGSD